MSPEKQELTFEASAYLQRLLGRELISTEELAVVELVKNAYDAGARHVVITIQPRTTREPGEIIIRDDGDGMSLNALRNVFMFAGYSERPDEVETARRIPTGEKGIGRFAADKLGHEIVVTTKTANVKQALRVEVDWDLFESRKKKFHDIRVPYRNVGSPELGSKGTILQITRLRSEWERRKIEALRNSLEDLLDPQYPPSDFQIELQVPGSLTLTGPISPRQLGAPDMNVSFDVKRGGKIKRVLAAPKLNLEETTENTPSSANTVLLQGLRGRLAYFLKRPNKSQTGGAIPSVRLYRDGFRVEPFGQDWLGVAERKARRAGHAHVVPSHLFGYVSISRKRQEDLRHTTSRETLIDNESLQALVIFLREQLAYLEGHIRTVVTEPRWKESKVRQAAEFERARFQTLGIMSVGLAHELRQPLQAIRSEADNIRERLQQLGIKDRDIQEAQKSIDTNIERIDRNIQNIARISSGSAENIEEIELSKFAQEQCDLLRPRCNAVGIKLTAKLPTKHPARINVMTVTTVMLNFIQNAIDALETQDGNRRKEIKMVLTRVKDNHILEVTDNGPGIDDDVRENIFRQFASKKTGGWGVGLYNCNLLVKSHGGSITFESTSGVGTTFRAELPDSYRG
jgi:signal transduction histidine kinase/anti-sigma regulatory factor (Ser/Thr protein kinase)